jgi:hypothetical protein
MNISKIIRRAILEQEQVRGLNFEDQSDILEKGRKNCPTFSQVIGDRPVKRLEKQYVSKFPDLGSKDEVAYISVPMGQNGVAMFFGVEDPESKGNKRSFLAYGVMGNQSPRKYTNGWGDDCEFMQKTSELGKDTLSDEQQKTLQAFLDANKGTYYSFVDKANQGEFEKVPYDKLTYPTTGRLVLPNYKGTGYVFKRIGLENVNQDKFEQMSSVLERQGFTRIEPENAESPEANAGFFIKDIAKDYPSLIELAKLSPNTKVWPKPGTLLIPNRNSCRNAIKLLNKCSKSTTISAECNKDLWKNKMLALQCGDKNFIGGSIGIGDEFDALLVDTGRFGLANLKTARNQGFQSTETPTGPNLNIKENVSSVVSKLLNEEYKRRMFRK